MPELWYICFFRFITGVYFARLTLLHPERLPKAEQPVLFLGLHRNGAVDGFVYYRLLGEPIFLISTQLTRSWFARLFFHGIAVTRRKDEGEHQEKDHLALARCVEHLRTGGKLCVFPEGTSSLGPRHLPFKSGAAWLIADYLENGGPPLLVLPVGIHYECPWAFRSKVEVVLGQPIATELPPGATRLARLKELKRRIEAGLEEVGINVASAKQQGHIQRLAYAATLATPRSYFQSLKALEKDISKPIEEAEASLNQRFPWNSCEPADDPSPALPGPLSPVEGESGPMSVNCLDPTPARGSTHLCFHQGVPLMPMTSSWLYALMLLVCAPIVGAALLLNLPPFLAGWFAGQKFPDDRNVISLWRILVGIPVFAIWIGVVSLLLILEGKLLLLGLYAAVTWLGLVLYYRVKKLAVAVHNGFRHPEVKPCLLAFHQAVLNNLPE